MIEERAPALKGIKTVLGQRERARSSSCPSIDQAHLDTVEMVRRSGKPAARLVDEQPRPLEIGQMIILPKHPRQHIDENRIELDARYVPKSEDMRGEYISAATDADYRGAACVPDVVSQIGNIIFQEFELPEIAV